MHGFFPKAYFEIEPQSDISYFLVEKLGNLWKKVDKMSPVFVCKISNINLYPNHVLKQYSKTKHKQYSEFKNILSCRYTHYSYMEVSLNIQSWYVPPLKHFILWKIHATQTKNCDLIILQQEIMCAEKIIWISA